MVQIKFIRQGSNSMLGGFSSGDRARVSEALAAHLVNEACVAVYVDPAAVSAAAAVASVDRAVSDAVSAIAEFHAAPVAASEEKPRRARRSK